MQIFLESTIFFKRYDGSSLVAQWIKDTVLPVLWLTLLLQLKLETWARNFCVSQAQPKKKYVRYGNTMQGTQSVYHLKRPQSFWCPCVSRQVLVFPPSSSFLPGSRLISLKQIINSISLNFSFGNT